MTATRFYFAGSGTPAFTPTPNAGWNVTGSQAVRPLLLASELGAGANGPDSSLTETSASVVNRLKRQHVSASQVTTAHTITGTMSVVLGCFETSASADAFLQVIAYVTNSTGTTVRGVLYSGQTATSPSSTVGDNAQEFDTSGLTYGSRTLSVTVSSVAASVGDRVVVELGYRACNTVTTSFGAQFQICDQSAAADLSFAAGTTTAGTGGTGIRPWVEFSDDIFGSGSTAWTGTAAQTITVGTSSAAKLGLGGSAAKALTVGTTSAGVRGKLGGATRALTVAASSAGVRGKVASTTQTLSITATSTGTVSSSGTAAAAKTITVSTTSALRLGVNGSSTKLLTMAATSTGSRGKVATATRALTVGSTSTARLGCRVGAGASLALAVTATGTVTSEAGSVTYWDGAAAHPAALLGWWDGAATQPATALGWWDGTTVHPLA